MSLLCLDKRYTLYINKVLSAYPLTITKLQKKNHTIPISWYFFVYIFGFMHYLF